MAKTWLLIAYLLLCTTAAHAVQFVAPSKGEIQEADKSFKFRGKWVHPKILHEFLPWTSDYDLPLITSIDIAAATGTNRYFGATKDVADGSSYKADDGETTSYEWKGRLKNGKHVVVIREFGSGTLVATSLLVVHFESQTGVDAKGKNYPRLVLVEDRAASLGDRAIVKTSMQDNKVSVDAKCAGTCDPKHLDLTFD